MTQEAILITTTPPLPGLTLVNAINDANLTIATDFAGSSDPAAKADAYMTWADTGTGYLKRRNAANSAWDIISRIYPKTSEDADGNVTVNGVMTATDGIVSNDVIESTSGGFKFPDDTVQTTAAVPSTGFGFKNRIINGAMMIDQRNAGASVTPADGAYVLDRWHCGLSQASKFSVQQNAG